MKPMVDRSGVNIVSIASILVFDSKETKVIRLGETKIGKALLTTAGVVGSIGTAVFIAKRIRSNETEVEANTE